MTRLRVLAPGFLTSVQDLGRWGLADQGIAPAGAMDPLSLRLGNLIVGNPPDAAALECTLSGPRLFADGVCLVALAGAPFDAWVEMRGGRVPLAPWQATHLAAGDVVHVGAARAGARAYLCVAGGFDLPPHHGSRATHLVAGLGGLDGRALREGDSLPIGAATRLLADLAGRCLRPDLWPRFPDQVTVRVTPGPQLNRFTEAAVETFLSSVYVVAADSNRMGVRLAGPHLTHTQGADVTSEGITLGAIQVPPSGQPIILMVDRQTTGGYTKPATVIGADIPRVGQARPGTRLRFQMVSMDEALAARRAQEDLVDETSIASGAWGPAEVTAILQAFAASGLAEMQLETAGLRLTLRREPTAGQTAEEVTSLATSAAPPTENALLAPLLGIFYRGPSPDAPPYVQPGDAVTQGQVVAVIDVMKTLHEVRASHAGRVTAVLAENGALVEYGQLLMTVAS